MLEDMVEVRERRCTSRTKAMDDRVWYEALGLFANGTSHHHEFLVASSEEAQQRIRNRYPHAVTILVRQGYPWTKRKESRMQL